MIIEIINATGKRKKSIPTTKISAVAVQSDVLRSQLTTSATKYGIAYKQGSYFIMDNSNTCYRIDEADFLLDYSKLKRSRMLRVDMYEDILASARKLEKIHKKKTINGNEYAVFALDGVPLFVPAKRINFFNWNRDTFYAVDEYSPIFAVAKDTKPKTLLGILGFVSQVQVSGFKLK